MGFIIVTPTLATSHDSRWGEHGRAGLNGGLFSETMDFLRQSWLYRLYYPLCVSRRIDTWHIVYLSNKDPCPKISVHKSEIKVP